MEPRDIGQTSGEFTARRGSRSGRRERERKALSKKCGYIKGREGARRWVNTVSSSSSSLGAGGGLGQGRDVELGIRPWTGGSRPAGERRAEGA